MVVAPLTRRQALLGALCAASCARVSAAADASKPQNAPTSGNTEAKASVDELAVAEIAPGVFIREGVDEDATPTNDNAIANIGFVIGEQCVAVVDPGGSLRDGERLRATIDSIASLPVRYVVLSHVHPDHIFGAGAFLGDRPQFIGHSKLPAMLAARGEYYRRELDSILGAGRAGPVVAPTQLVKDTLALDLGGRVLRVTAWPTAHSDCDLTVRDSESGTLFAADLLFSRRVPSLDGSLKGWLAVLETLKSTKAARAVPGHGPMSVDWPHGSSDLERYLNILLVETRQAIAKGMDIAAAARTVGRSEQDRWQLFDAYHGHNVVQAFKELEWE